MKITLRHCFAVLLLTGGFCQGAGPSQGAKSLHGDMNASAGDLLGHTFSINADSVFRFGAENRQTETMGEKHAFPRTRDSASPSNFTLQAPLADDLSLMSLNAALGGVIDNLDLLRTDSILGLPVNDVQFGLGALKLISDSVGSLHEIAENPNDPGSDWERASLGLNLFSFLSPAELLSPAAGQIAALGDLVKTVGEATRSRVLENRAERLAFTGGMPLQLREFHERLGTYDGSFSFKTSELNVRGQYELRHYSDRLFERRSVFDAVVSTHMENLRLMDGSMVSGDVIRKETRVESGASIWNFYRTTSTETHQHSTERYQISFDGSKWQQQGNVNQVLHVAPPDFLFTRQESISDKPDKKKFLTPLPEPPKKPLSRNEPPFRGGGPSGGGSGGGNPTGGGPGGGGSGDPKSGGVDRRTNIGPASFRKDPKLDKLREELLRKKPR